MNDGLIPNRYAKALFKLSQERGDTQVVYNEMKRLDVAYAAQAGLKKAVNNPFLPIADKLKLSRRTVEAHKSNIFGKLDCKSTAELVQYAFRNGLID